MWSLIENWRIAAAWRKIFVKCGSVIALGAKKNAEVLSKKTVPRHFSKMGWQMGLEPTTLGTTIRCSNQLSYCHHLVKPAFEHFWAVMSIYF